MKRTLIVLLLTLVLLLVMIQPAFAKNNVSNFMSALKGKGGASINVKGFKAFLDYGMPGHSEYGQFIAANAKIK